MSLRAVSFQMHDADFTAKYCHYRRISGNIEGCERPSNTLFSWGIMTNSRFLSGFVISRSSVRIRLPAHLLWRGIMTTFDIALGFPIHIMAIGDVALDFPMRAHDHPKFPRSNLRTAQSRANDWNVILSSDRAYVKPVKRDLSWWTGRFCCGRAESANKILFGRPTRSDLVDLLLCNGVARRCVTR